MAYGRNSSDSMVMWSALSMVFLVVVVLLVIAMVLQHELRATKNELAACQQAKSGTESRIKLVPVKGVTSAQLSQVFHGPEGAKWKFPPDGGPGHIINADGGSP